MSNDPFNCPKCGAHDFGLNRPRCPHCGYIESESGRTGPHESPPPTKIEKIAADATGAVSAERVMVELNAIVQVLYGAGHTEAPIKGVNLADLIQRILYEHAEYKARAERAEIAQVESSAAPAEGVALQEAMQRLLAAIEEIPPKENGYKLLNAYDAVLKSLPSANALTMPTEDEIAAYRNLFRAELDKNMNNSSASPSTDAHRIALRAFVQRRADSGANNG